jgi:hypothetical protein
MIEPIDELIVEATNVPHVVHKGVYTLWEKPDGTLRIQYRREGNETDDFVELPGVMVKMAKAASEGKMNPMDMMKAVMSMGKP